MALAKFRVNTGELGPATEGSFFFERGEQSPITSFKFCVSNAQSGQVWCACNQLSKQTLRKLC